MLRNILAECASIPCNTSSSDLPRAYRGNLKWGLDCFGFVELLQQYHRDVQLITGIYARNFIHAAALSDGQFVDPFLKMVHPMDISATPVVVDTYYTGSTLLGRLMPHSSIFSVDLVRAGRTLSTYTYDLEEKPSKHRQAHAYKYTLLSKGSPVAIAKIKSLKDTSEVSVIGADTQTAEQILSEEQGLHIADIAKMFFDADQNKGLFSFLRS